MRFVCNGTILGYTVALKRKSGEEHPVIQVWRKRNDPQSLTYNKVVDIPLDEALCTAGFTEAFHSGNIGIFHCNLSESTQKTVQPGDILGLKLPSTGVASADVYFANVSHKEPTNYIFNHNLLSSSVMLCNHTSVNQELPQITLDMASGKLYCQNVNLLLCQWNVDLCFAVHSADNCTRGFLDFPALFESDGGGNSNVTITLLIPDMNFTCDATLAGFTFTAINRRNKGQQDPKIQIWREHEHQTGIYYKTGPAIVVNNSKDTGVCDDGLPDIARRTYWCFLKKDFQVSVQPGDVLGLELPHTDDDDFDFLFTEGGPMNYIFEQPLNSTIELSNHQTSKSQLPQITFSLTSGTL